MTLCQTQTLCSGVIRTAWHGYFLPNINMFKTRGKRLNWSVITYIVWLDILGKYAISLFWTTGIIHVGTDGSRPQLFGQNSQISTWGAGMTLQHNTAKWSTSHHYTSPLFRILWFQKQMLMSKLFLLSAPGSYCHLHSPKYGLAYWKIARYF